MRWCHHNSVFLLLICLVAIFSGCGSSGDEKSLHEDETPLSFELLPAETFVWTTGQPISFSPPPSSWRRTRYQNGGAEGVDFVLSRDQIIVAERFFLGKLDHCAVMVELIENVDTWTPLEFGRRLPEARLTAGKWSSQEEKWSVEAVNNHLATAGQAFAEGDRFVAKAEVQRALARAQEIRYNVEDCVDRVIFTKEDNTVYPQLEVEEPVGGEVAGEDSVVVAFSFVDDQTEMTGRRIYVVKNNRMFEFGFQGRSEHLPVFEKLLESVRFPAGVCRH